jgi:Carboxypeptidase regulatory-like domain/TonB-dependent Receptor Plug Domain
MRLRWIGLGLFILGSYMANQLIGQGTFGRISGRVTDSTGAVIPNAALTLTNTATGVQKKAVTGANGYYNFPDLLPGRYTVRAELKGFATVVVPSLVVQVDQSLRNDIVMTVGAATTTVNVEAMAPLLQTETSSTGQVITGQRTQEMPLNGRQVYSLVLLVPGASENPGAQSQFSINGQRGNETSMLVDGVDTRMFQNGKPAFSPSVDAVEEFKVQENATSAAYGDGTAVVNVALRGGTNQLHGDAWEFVRNDALAATGYFNKVRQPLVRNQYGITVGGPIQKNRTFFFAYYEGLGTRAASSDYAVVPTPANLQGDFTGSPQIYNPFSLDPITGQRLPFTSNMIPSTMVSQFAKAAAQLYPTPVSTGLAGYNFVKSVSNSESSNQVSLRIDHEFSQNDSLFGTVIWSHDNSATGSPLPLTGSAFVVNGTQIALHETHVFTPTLLNQFALGYTYGRNVQTGQLASTPLATQAFGLKNLKIPAVNQGMPQLNFGISVLSGGSSASTITPMGTSPNLPFGGLENQYLLQDDVSWTHNLHQIKFGGEIRQYRPTMYDQGTPNGNLTFDGQFTGLIGTTGNSVADFVLGLPYTATATELGLSDGGTDLRWTHFAAYFQDDFHFSPKLTLNLGMRYDYDQPFREVHSAAQVWSPTLNEFLVPGQGINGLVNPDRNNFGPRLGFAYTVAPRTVIRAGVGVFYGFIRGLELSSGYHLDPPYNVSETVNSNPVTPTILPGTLFPLATAVPTPTTSLFSVNHNFPSNYTYEYNLTLQQELGHSLSVQLGYVGSSSHKLTGRTLINQAHVDANPTNPTPIQSRRPFQGAADISITNSIDQANYNALQVTVEKRYSSGFSILGVYGWSKALGIAEGGDQSSVGNQYAPRHNYYGPTPYDQPQRLTFSTTYELPIGAGKAIGGSLRGLADKLVSGWQAGGIGTFFKGEYESVNSNVSANVGRVDRNFPNCVANPNHGSGIHTIHEWFNTAAFASQPFGTFGNCRAGVVENPGENNIDFSMIKNTRFKDRYNVQIRSEFFNVFNHPSFGAPAANLGSSSFGVISTTRTNARIIQLAGKFYW